MPTISVHIDKADWEAIKFYAAQEQMTPEQFIKNALRNRLGSASAAISRLKPALNISPPCRVEASSVY